jgi:hypothetical protein
LVERVHCDLLVVWRGLALFQPFDQPRGKSGESGGSIVAGPQLRTIPGELERIRSRQDVKPGITA